MSGPDEWTAVDDFLTGRLLPHDAAMAAVLDANAAAGLPAIDVSPAQGKFLHLLARIAGARRVLEVGTLGGYSTIWIARALPEGGRVVTIEVDAHHAETARKNFARAGVSGRIDLRVGAGGDVLPTLAAERAEPFDMVFIDADKPNNPVYLDWALKLSRPGTVIIGDNVVRKGAVADATSDAEDVVGTRAMIAAVAASSRLDATVLQTVGVKGWDGFMLAVVR